MSENNGNMEKYDGGHDVIEAEIYLKGYVESVFQDKINEFFERYKLTALAEVEIASNASDPDVLRLKFPHIHDGDIKSDQAAFENLMRVSPPVKSEFGFIITGQEPPKPQTVEGAVIA